MDKCEFLKLKHGAIDLDCMDTRYTFVSFMLAIEEHARGAGTCVIRTLLVGFELSISLRIMRMLGMMSCICGPRTLFIRSQDLSLCNGV